MEHLVQEIEKTCQSFYASQISKTEQYLAYGGSDKFKKMEIQLRGSIMCVQFTDDSNFLFVSFRTGNVYQYDILNDFRTVFQEQIHNGEIYNIIPILDKWILTSPAQNYIIKTNLKNKQQIFRLSGHNNDVYTIQYMQLQDILVCGSHDKSIKFWNCQDQTQNSFIKQISLNNKEQNFLSLSHEVTLVKWKIDLINKDLIKLKQFSGTNRIYNMYFNQNDLLIITSDKYVKILNIDNITVKQIDHQAGPNQQQL